jgi:hypothetical protein
MPVTNIKDITLDALIALFDPSVHDRLRELAKRETVSHLVVFEVLDLSSSQLGHRTAVAIGPGCTYTQLYQIKNQRLGDVPSRFQYPVAAAATKPG